MEHDVTLQEKNGAGVTDMVMARAKM